MERTERLERYLLHQDTTLPMLGTDSLLLSRFCTVKRGAKVLDLGCGVGVLGVLLAERCENLILDGVELNPASAALAERNLSENGLTGRILWGDMRSEGWFTEGHYDLVLSNPPYFPERTGFHATQRNAEARSELTCTLSDLCRSAAPRLKTGGRFAVVCRTERLTDLLCAMRDNGIEPKRLQMVQTAPHKPPKLFLCEGIRQGGNGLKIEPNLVLSSHSSFLKKV